MRQRLHRILSKDAATLTGVCSFCGPVKLKRKTKGRLACMVSERQHRGTNNLTIPSARYRAMRVRAETQGLPFDISREEHAHLLSEACVYCGSNLNPTGSGMDRKDSSLGYTKENVVPCCSDCNRVKNNILTHEEMIAAMQAVLKIRAMKSPH